MGRNGCHEWKSNLVFSHELICYSTEYNTDSSYLQLPSFRCEERCRERGRGCLPWYPLVRMTCAYSVADKGMTTCEVIYQVYRDPPYNTPTQPHGSLPMPMLCIRAWSSVHLSWQRNSFQGIIIYFAINPYWVFSVDIMRGWPTK